MPAVPGAMTCMNGGTLGTGSDLRVWLTNRGATNLLAELFPDSGSFERVISATGELTMEKVVGGGSACEEWAAIIPWATEILVIRDGRDQFGGPTTESTYPTGKAQVAAADLSAWWDRRRTPTLKFKDADPYRAAGVYASVLVKPFKQVLP